MELCPHKACSGAPGLVDRVFAIHAGRGFDSHRRHMSERLFRSNGPGYPHPVRSELKNSGIRVAVSDCSVTERRRWRPPYQTCKPVHVHANTTRTDARRRVCAAMVPYRWAIRGTSLRELEYTHIHMACFSACSGDNQIEMWIIHALTFVFDEWLDDTGFFRPYRTMG